MIRSAFRSSGLLILAVAVLSPVFPAQAEFFGSKKEAAPPSPNAPQSFADLSARLLPAVVNISSTQAPKQSETLPEMPELPPGSPFEDFFKDYMDRQQNGEGNSTPSLPSMSLGSGFVIDADKGLVVTNNHVIKDADEIRVTLHDDTTLDAKLLGSDEKTDLALLQVEKKPSVKLTAVTFGNSDVMRVGDWILAIGNPFGLGGTVTSGIISARQRDINSGPYDDYLQTDASINRGNSGGPMFNLKGEVIGINTAIFSPSGGSVGIGFAIPSNLAKAVIAQLSEYGHTRRGWLGVKIQNVTDEIADSLGLKGTHGALIASVTPGGPAEKSGLQAGDVILEFNGQKLDAMRQLPRIVAETKIGTEAPVALWREGKTLTVKVKVGELEKAEEEGLIETADTGEDNGDIKGTALPFVGLSVSDLTDAVRGTFEIPDTAQGVIVTDVEAKSEAADKNMSVGDVVVEINQAPVTDAASAKKLMEDAKAAGKTSVLMLVDHQGKGDVRFVALRLKGPETKNEAPQKK
jgi:serine protease Do